MVRPVTNAIRTGKSQHLRRRANTFDDGVKNPALIPRAHYSRRCSPKRRDRRPRPPLHWKQPPRNATQTVARGSRSSFPLSNPTTACRLKSHPPLNHDLLLHPPLPFSYSQTLNSMEWSRSTNADGVVFCINGKEI